IPATKRPASFTLWVHDPNFSPHEVVINPELFPLVSGGDLLEIIPAPSSAAAAAAAADPAVPAFLSASSRRLGSHSIPRHPSQASPFTSTPKPHDAPLFSDISIAQHLATTFGLQARISVFVKKVVDKGSMAAEYVTLAFRDQYIARSDMWRLKMSLHNSCLYVGKKVASVGGRAQVREIIANNRPVACGYITESTKAIFRSESARTFLFIQMSKEMWEFTSDGDLYFEKCVNGFLPDLFNHWKRTGATHVVSIVLFARVFFDETGRSFLNDDESLNVSPTGRLYQDFYRVVVEWESHVDWTPVLIPLKKEFIQFEKDVLQRSGGDGSFVLSGMNCPAAEGNILEAINLALNPFDKHYIDRDLLRTGLSIVIVSPSPGLFEVDKLLCRLTTQRMIDNGIACDFVSLAQPPLYTVPLFQFQSKVSRSNDPNVSTQSHLSGSTNESGGTIDLQEARRVEFPPSEAWDPLYHDENNEGEERMFFAIPHWVEVSFYDYDNGSHLTNGSKFYPRCSVGDLSTSGASGLDPSIYVEPLETSLFSSPQPELLGNGEVVENVDPFDRYDELMFKGISRNSSQSYHIMSDIVTPFSGSAGASGSRSQGVGSYASIELTKTLGGSRYGAGASTPGLWAHEGEEDFLSRSLGNSDAHLHHQTLTKNAMDMDHSNRHSHDRFDAGRLTVSANRLDDQKAIGNAAQAVSPSTLLPPMNIHNAVSRSRNVEHFENDYENGGTGGYSSRSESAKGGESPGASVLRYLVKNSPIKNSLPRGSSFRFSFINPCNQKKNILRLDSRFRRWQHVVPFISVSPSTYRPVTSWRSLATPACLPLTTDFFPTAEQLSELYWETTYTVTVSLDDEMTPYQLRAESEFEKLDSLRMELVSQRLSQGFQLIVSNSVEKTVFGAVPEDSTLNHGQGVSLFWAGGKAHASSKRATAPFFVSLGDHVHRLFFDSSGKNVEVKQYIRKVSYDTSPFNYKCAVWPKLHNGYTSSKFVFTHPSLAAYKWNFHDAYISGLHDDMTDPLRYWRTRFMLVPMESVPQSSLLNPSNENLDEEELRLAGFNRIREMFERSRWRQPHETDRKDRDRIRPISGLKVQQTTQLASAYVREEWSKNLVAASHPKSHQNSFDEGAFAQNELRITKAMSNSAIAGAMQDPVTGCPIKDRRWHFRLYENVFIGSECVDWMLRSFRDINTRDDAVAFGNVLKDRGVFDHANMNHRFLDGHYFYRINKDYVLPPSDRDRSSAAGLATPSAWFRPRSIVSDSRASLVDVEETPRERLQPKVKPVELSRKIVIDMDPQRRSSRREMAELHYNTFHNSKNRQLHWLTCSSRLVEDLLQSWARTAEKCGLKFVEAPVEQAEPFSNDDPFQSVIEIDFAASPPPVSSLQENDPTVEFHPEWAEIELGRRFGFVMDVEAEDLFPTGSVQYSYTRPRYRWTQLVHRSGAAFLQIRREGKGFRWVNNRLHLVGGGVRVGAGGAASASSMDEVRMQLTAMCSDARAIRAFWDEVAAMGQHMSSTVEVLSMNEHAENAGKFASSHA
ncbi:hypothetical protein DFJ73DRAFT_916836, partial [Zopfochytrium polystomum]